MDLPVDARDSLSVIAYWALDDLDDIGAVSLPELEDKVPLAVVKVHVVGKVLTQLIQREVLSDDVLGRLLGLLVK